ncbi:hypothetical protein GCM10027277_22290 [Pseudoduganella ginsengisoli]|uniref:Lipopolysaccharide biosynthesis protein n=2 Tax=Pseudoduganella ginsengisoli TaxID=1462440 RepID=A0A6L6PSV8_9BURK|nr:lipopolysaccharide biosynthesis protein [Pseudoduganella ginsengisoli]
MQTSATTLQQSDNVIGHAIIDKLIALSEYKKLIIGFPAVIAIVTVGICLTMKDIYKASTKILPPQQAQSSAAALLSQLGGAASAVAGVAGIKNPNDLFIGMLKSRRVADNLIARYELPKVYENDSMEKVRKRLADNTLISTGKDGVILVEVLDHDKKLAPRLANSYVEELQKLTQAFALTESSQRRVFFERQLALSKDNLAAAELALNRSLEANGVISVDSDSRAIVEMVSRLRAQIAAKEIELNSMRAFVTKDNHEYKRTQEQLSSLRDELNKLQNGNPARALETAAGSTKGQEGLKNIKILREVKYHQMLFELLSKQYEAARLDEAKDAPMIQVLDSAIEPERKFKPGRVVIVLTSTMMAFFVALGLALFLAAKKKALRDPELAAKWTQFKRNLRFGKV